MQRISTPTSVHEANQDIIIRSAEPTDGHVISNYFIANKEFLKPWEPRREESFYTEAHWTQKLIKLNELHRLGLAYYLLIIDRQSKQMLGTVSFSNMSRFPSYACSLGYSLAENAQGRGVMTAAVKLALNYMFKVQNIHRVMASYMPRNHKSEAVLKRVGFTKEGFAKDYLLINGKWEDHNLTSIINPNWQPTS